MVWTLGELAERVSAELHGDADCRIERVATLAAAGPGDITFLSNTRYRKYLKQTRASAVILATEELSSCPVNALVMENPYLGYAHIAGLLYPGPVMASPGVAASACIHESADISASACISDHVVIGPRCVVGENTCIGAGTVLGEQVHLGRDCYLHPNVVLCHDVIVGNKVILHPGAVIGSDGFGIANDAGRWVNIPQVGSVIIGDDVQIGSNSTVDRGAIENTVIGDGVRIDNQVQVGHNVYIGEHTAIAGCVGISGSVHIGKRCLIGGAVGINGHLSICDDAVITAMSAISKSITKPGMYSSAIPFSESRAWRKNVARFRHLDELYKRVIELEKKLQQ